MSRVASRPSREVAAEIAQPWLALGRIAIVSFAGGLLALWVAGLPGRYRALARPCNEGAECLALYLGPLETAAMPAWLGLEAYALFLTGIEGLVVLAGLTVAGLLLVRTSHTRMGLLAAAAMVWVGFAGEVLTSLQAETPIVETLLAPIEYVGLAIFWSFVLLFPSGRIESRWMRRAWPIFFAVLVFALSVGALADLHLVPEAWLPSETAWILIFFPILLLPFVLQVVRFRRASPEQRQQLKWGLLGLGAMMLGFLVWASIDPLTTPVPRGGARLAWNLAGWTLAMACATMLPVSIAYAILRHRLWDLDVVINRALVYGSLTLSLTGIYVATVVLVQRVALGGRESPLVVAGSTLLIAALFAPLRRRFQSFIDRRFYRRKIDRRRALEVFSTKARSQVDLDVLTAELLHVVGESVQPKHMGVWLKSRLQGRRDLK